MEDIATVLHKLERKNTRLKALVQKYKQSHHLQNALIQLSEQASSVAELNLLYPAIHDILQDYVPCKSFYVALQNQFSNTLELSYFADEKDGISVALNQDNNFSQGVTGYAFKQGKTTYFNRKKMQAAADAGHFRLLGTPAEHWISVPIYREKSIMGVLVTQSYDVTQSFSEQQIELLEVMALYLSTAIERVKKRELLEAEVKIRTRALTQSNEALNLEIEQHKKTLERQYILFKISELATQSKNIDEVYKQVHEIIKSITYADNLYIALYDSDTGWLNFPYYVDEFNRNTKPRPFAKGYSELVLRTEQTQLIDSARAEKLRVSGEVKRLEPYDKSQSATSWLGAPLKTAQGVIGLITCQAYDNKHFFDQDDFELITFVSHQIATVLQAHLAAQALKQSNQQLEHRVAEKTKEISQTNMHLQMQIEERKKIEQQLYHDAHHDPLTGLPNRSLFLTQLEKTLQHYQRYPEQQFAVLFIDLDKFKNINDQLGHQAGDQFLIGVSESFSQCIREHDLLARLGGDEFVILLTHLTERQQAEDVAKRLIKLMKKPFCMKGICVQSGASVGITYSKTSYKHTDEIIRDADAAMYYAKNAGRSRFEFYHPLLNAGTSPYELETSHHLDSLPMHFRCSEIITLNEQHQPESLLEAYGEHPVLGSTSFDILKKFAADKEQQLEVEVQLLNKACQQAHKVQLNMVLFPCSGLMIEQIGFQPLCQTLQNQVIKSQICLLFNEQEIRYASAVQISNLKKLSEKGYTIGLNDFAKDRCELNLLTEINFDYLLLSSTFSKRVLQQNSYDLQLQGVLAITKIKQVKVIAKGPSILNYRALLDSHGLSLFIGKQHAIGHSATLPDDDAEVILN